MATITFKNINVNPHGEITNDCVIRALTVLEDIKYEQTIVNLTKVYIETGLHINDNRCLFHYLKTNKKYTNVYTQSIFEKTKPETHITLKQFCDNILIDNKKYNLLFIYKDHVTVIKDNILVDTKNYLNSDDVLLDIWEFN